jgi:hypothetical protein
VVVLFSFHDQSIIAWLLRLGTLRWYGVLAGDAGMLAAGLASVKLALLAVVIALAVGVPGAFVLDRLEFPGKGAFRRLVLLPLILPGIITGVALLSFFSLLKLSLSSGYPVVPGWPVVLGHGTALTPVVTNPDVTQDTINATICVRGWTKTVRPPVSYTNPLKRELIAEDGYATTEPRIYELENFITLELGDQPTKTENL